MVPRSQQANDFATADGSVVHVLAEYGAYHKVDHEELSSHLESVWNQSKGQERDLVGGIILVCAGLVHYQKNEEDICISILGRAFKKLADARGVYHRVDIDRLKQIVCNILKKSKVELFKI